MQDIDDMTDEEVLYFARKIKRDKIKKITLISLIVFVILFFIVFTIVAACYQESVGDYAIVERWPF